MSNPVVSICSQVYNHTKYLPTMIQSVVDQTFKDWELVIVDDGSTEDLKAVVDSFNDSRIRLIRLDVNGGNPFGINIAMKAATGKYVGCLAADEFIIPDKLEVQVAYMESHPGVDCIWGLPGKFDMGTGLRPLWEQSMLRAHNRSNEAWIRDLLAIHVPIGGASLLMKMDVMRDCGYLHEEYVIFGEHGLFLTFFSKGYTGVILPYRWADENSENIATSVRAKHYHKKDDEIARFRAKFPLKIPVTTGKVTIGIPCYNHARYLKDSVGSVLAQTHKDLEVLILNDGGTDNFTDVVNTFNDPRIKVMAFPENMGIWEAQNQMAFRAQGDFYVPFAADDIMEPNFVEKCLGEFQNNPWLEMVASHTDFIKEDGSVYDDQTNPMLSIAKPVNRNREEFLAALHPGNMYFGAGMYRTRVISDVGGWEKQYKVIADYQMYLKILQRETIGIIEEPLTHTRVDGKNHSLLDKERSEELPHLYHAARKPYYRQLMKVIIATPFYELKGFSPYIQSLQHTIRLLTMHGIDWRFMELSGDSYVHRARNTMCDQFLADPDATDLFFVDSDMSWDANAFVKMCLLPEEIVGGAYPVKNCWDAWTSIPHWQQENGVNVLKGKELGDGSALIEALVIAGGFIRIKRSALEKFRVHYPDLWYREGSSSPDKPQKQFTQFFGAESIDHQFYGEDHMFSRKMREMGMKMYIYPNVDLQHWGYKNFPGNFDKFLRKQARELGPPDSWKEPMDQAHTIKTEQKVA